MTFSLYFITQLLAFAASSFSQIYNDYILSIKTGASSFIQFLQSTNFYPSIIAIFSNCKAIDLSFIMNDLIGQ